jgi:hypothetical protein
MPHFAHRVVFEPTFEDIHDTGLWRERERELEWEGERGMEAGREGGTERERERERKKRV